MTSAVTEQTARPLEEGPRPRPSGAGTLFRRKGLGTTIASILLMPICVIWIYPFLWMVSSAFKTDAEIFEGLNLIPNELQWENFGRAWTDASMGQYFLNTVIITVSSVAIVVISSAMIGYALGRYNFPGKKLLLTLYVATVFVPEGYTIIPIFAMINNLGLADSLLGVILGISGGAHVIIMLLFAGFFRQLPNELEEAAIIDGAGFFRVFWKIMMPMSTPVIATAIILQLMHSWNAYLLPLVLTLSRPDLRPIAVGMRAFQGEYFNDWSGMAAAATISLIPIIVVFIFLQKYFVNALAGAVKQ